MRTTFAAAVVAAVALSPLAAVPVPAAQTAHQKAYMAAVAPAARAASAAAEGDLVAFLDTADFRAAFRRFCPGCDAAVLAEPGALLLERFRGALDVAEFVHNFESVPDHRPSAMVDVDITDCLNASTPYLLNQWELFALGRRTYRPFGGLPGNPVDIAERSLFDCPPIADVAHPTMEEAVERPVYTALNWFRFDDGNSNFGDVSVVFQPAFIRPLGFMSPVDTGLFEMWCNKSLSQASAGEPRVANCSAWDGSEPLGTTDSFLHLVLPSAYFWNGTVHERYPRDPTANATFTPAWERLGLLFARTFGRWGPNVTNAVAPPTVPLLEETQFLRYPELDLAGTALFPDAVKFVIVNFGQTFGTEYGAQLRQWTALNNWTLAWALGDFNALDQHSASRGSAGGSSTSNNTRAAAMARALTHAPAAGVFRYLANQRVLDPLYTGASNFSASSATRKAFAATWDAVVATRLASVNGTLNSTQALALWETLDAELFVEPLRYDACGDNTRTAADHCVGVTVVSGDCVCYPRAA